jgi:hypothetical protein
VVSTRVVVLGCSLEHGLVLVVVVMVEVLVEVVDVGPCVWGSWGYPTAARFLAVFGELKLLTSYDPYPPSCGPSSQTITLLH